MFCPVNFFLRRDAVAKRGGCYGSYVSLSVRPSVSLVWRATYSCRYG